MRTESDNYIIYPFLFSLYLNDLELFLENYNITGLNSLYDEIEPKLTFFQRTIHFKYGDMELEIAK